MQRAGWAAASWHLEVRLRPSKPWWARTGHSWECWSLMLAAPGRLFRDTAGPFSWALVGIHIQRRSWFVDKHSPDLLLHCEGLDGEEGISAVTNAEGVEEFKRENKQLFFFIRRNWCQESAFLKENDRGMELLPRKDGFSCPSFLPLLTSLGSAFPFHGSE